MAGELLLLFTHQEANVSPTESQQGSSGTQVDAPHTNPKATKSALLNCVFVCTLLHAFLCVYMCAR